MALLNRISRNLFQEVIGDRNKRKAIAYAIYMKDLKQTSVVKDWSYRRLAREAGLATATCKKYVHLLREMKLVSMRSYKGHNYLTFKKLKEHKKKNRWNSGYHTPKHKDVKLGNYSPTSIKAIEGHLEALLICEVQRQKDYVQQSISTAQNPKNHLEYKKAKKICCARGWSSFNDSGISYKYMCNALNSSPNTVSSTIKYGEKVGLFTVTRSAPQIVFYGPGEARIAAEYLDEKYSYCTDNAIYYQPANKFTLTVSQ